MHGRPCRHIESALPTGDGLWPLPRHMWCRFRKVAAFARLCVFGGLCESCDDWYTNGDFCCFDCTPMVLTVLTNGTLYQSSKTLKTIGVQIVTGLPRLYQRCTNRQKQSKDSQNSKNDHWCTNRHRSTKTVPTVYQSSKTVKTAQKWPMVYQSSHVYQDCTNHVPTVYTKNSQKTVKIAKMTIGVPIVTVLPRLYQQCNNSLPIINKNLAIANRLRAISCAHNTSWAFIGLNITPWPWNLD